MKFKLLEKSTHQDESGIHVLLEPGTEIGDKTPYPIRRGVDEKRTAFLRIRDPKAPEVLWFIPGHHMEPLDDEAKKLLATVPDALTLESMPLTMDPLPAGATRKAVGF